jgi:hypothetical protein
MGNFLGGSAFAMASQIGEGHLLVTERSFAKLATPELDQLSHELERLLRDWRGSLVAIDDTLAVNQRNRAISRLQSAVAMVRAHRQKRR